MDDRRARQRRLDRAWVLARFEFVVAVTVVLLAVFVYIAAPGFVGGGRYYPSQGWWLPVVVLPAIGIGGIVLGFVWMIRIYRPRHEDGERTWRYRDD